MKHTKYYIEGEQAAHSGNIRACRYNKEENRKEWFLGFDSVIREFVVFLVIPLGNSGADYSPVYVGRLADCLDKCTTLRNNDRKNLYVVYNFATKKEYTDQY